MGDWKWCRHLILKLIYPLTKKSLKKVFRPFAMRLKIACILFPLIILDVSTTWLESTCGKFNWLDMIWKGHTSVYIRSPSWQCMLEQKPSHEVKGIVRRAPRQDYVKAQICSIESPQEHGGKVWNHQDSLPRAGHPAKLSNPGRWPRTRWSLWQSSRVPLWKWENPPEGQPSLQHSTNQAFMIECPDASHSSVKATWQPAWGLPKGT